jgi:hypothetical protein
MKAVSSPACLFLRHQRCIELASTLCASTKYLRCLFLKPRSWLFFHDSAIYLKLTIHIFDNAACAGVFLRATKDRSAGGVRQPRVALRQWLTPYAACKRFGNFSSYLKQILSILGELVAGKETTE